MDGLKKLLAEADLSLGFLGVLLLSLLLSWRTTALQREGLCRLLAVGGGDFPDVLPLRRLAGELAVGPLVWFFLLALEAWEQEDTPSARVNLWAALFVLAAALLRLYDLNCLQEGAADALLPD